MAALDAGWADPARLHREGRQANHLLQTGRAVLADGVGCRPESLSLHPSPAQALETAVAGLRRARRRLGDGLVTSAVDQSLLLALAGDRHPVEVGATGAVTLGAWSEALRAPALAAAVLGAANGEVGTRQPVAAAFEECRVHGIPFLLDGTASWGRDVVDDAWDVFVGSAAVFGGPPLGVLAVRPGVRFDASAPGRDVEWGRSLATPWVPTVLAAAEAWQQTRATADEDAATSRALVDLVRGAAAEVTDVEVVGDPIDRLPHVVTFSAWYADGEALVRAFDRRGFAVDSCSACTSSTLRPSHVLAAMGALTHGNVRITLPLPSATPGLADQVTALLPTIADAVAEVRAELGTTDL